MVGGEAEMTTIEAIAIQEVVALVEFRRRVRGADAVDEEPDFDAVLLCLEDVSSDVIGIDMREIGEDGCHGFTDVGGVEQIAGVGEIPTRF